jgi:hypothetical protein
MESASVSIVHREEGLYKVMVARHVKALEG